MAITLFGKYNVYWIWYTPGTGNFGSGFVEVDFGVGGSTSTSVVVPGQAAIAANSQCEAWADVSDPTVDHTTADHLAAAPHMRFQAGDPIVPGASFTVYVSTEDGIPGVAIGAGGATVSNGTVALSNANGVSFGFGAGPNTSVLSASVAAQSVQPAIGSISVIGNTAGNTSAGSGTIVVAGGNNVTLSGATALGAMTLSIIGAAGVGGGASIAVNGGAASNGGVTFSNSNNVSFGGAGSVVTASASFSQSVQPALGSISLSGNTSGTTSAGSGSIILAGGPNITLSAATALGLMSISISGNPPQSVQPGIAGIAANGSTATTGSVVFSNANGLSFGFGVGAASTVITGSYTVPTQSVQPAIGSVSFGGNTSGTTSAGSGTLVLAGGPNVTLSGATAAGIVTISISAGAGANGGIAVNGGGASTGSVTFSNSNNVTFGGNASVITASFSQSVQPALGSISIGGNTSGSTSAGSGSLVLAGGPNITLSGSTAAGAMTISISGNAAQSTQPAIGSISVIGNTSGSTSAGSGTLVLAGGPNVTLSGSTAAGALTLSLSVAAQSAQPAIQSIAAGGVTATTGLVQFSNSNGVSFGLNASTMTASVGAGATATGNFGALAAGTQTASSGTVVLANSNGISFGMSGSSQITASYTVPVQTVQPGIQAVSAGTQTATTGTLVMSNSNNVSFGIGSGASTSILTASASFPAQSVQPGIAAVSAGTQTATTGTVVWSNSNNVSFGLGSGASTSILTASASFAQSTQAALGSISIIGNTSGTTSAGSGSLILAGGPNITLSGSTAAGALTISVSANAPGAIALNGGAGSPGTITFSNSNNITFGGNASVVTMSVDVGGIAVNGGASSTGAITFSNSNNVSFGGNASVITAIVPALGSISVLGNTAGNTSAGSGSLILAGGNNITLSGATAAGAMTLTVLAGAAGGGGISASAGAQSTGAGLVVWSNSNNVIFGMTNSSVITASASYSSEPFNQVAAGTQTGAAGSTVVFSNSNNITFGMSNSSVVTASFSQSVQPALGSISVIGNTSGNTSAGSGSIIFAGGPNVTLSGSTAAGAMTLSISAGAGGGGAAISAGTQSVSTGTVVFANSNGITFGMSGSSQITASFASSNIASGGGISLSSAGSTVTISNIGVTGIAASSQSALTGSNGLVVFSNSNGVSFGLGSGASTSVMTASIVPGGIQAFGVSTDAQGNTGSGTGSVWLFEGGVVNLSQDTAAGVRSLTVSVGAGLSSLSLGGNTAGTSNMGSGSLMLAGGPNITLSGSSAAGGITISISGQPSGTGAGLQALAVPGTTLNNATIVFSASNGITFGMNAGTVTAGLVLESRYDYWPQGAISSTRVTQGTGSIQRFDLPGAVTFSRVDIPMLFSMASSATTNTGAMAVSSALILYTRSGSTLSPILGTLDNTTYTWASNTSNFGSVTGPRLVSFPLASALYPGEYYAYFHFSTKSSSVGLSTTNLAVSASLIVHSTYSASNWADFGQNTANSSGIALGQGTISSLVSNSTQTIQMSQVTASGAAMFVANFPLLFRNY